MPYARLRRVLTRPLSVSVESTAAVAAAVQRAAGNRPVQLNPEQASPYVPLLGHTSLAFRAIDFLRKIGELTTPKHLNLARLSSGECPAGC